MYLNKTINNLIQTKNSYFNIANDSPLNFDIIKKNMFFINKNEKLKRKRKIIRMDKYKHATLIKYFEDNMEGISLVSNYGKCFYLSTLKL